MTTAECSLIIVAFLLLIIVLSIAFTLLPILLIGWFSELAARKAKRSVNDITVNDHERL